MHDDDAIKSKLDPLIHGNYDDDRIIWLVTGSVIVGLLLGIWICIIGEVIIELE
jgi:hypothetical protein